MPITTIHYQNTKTGKKYEQSLAEFRADYPAWSFAEDNFEENQSAITCDDFDNDDKADAYNDEIAAAFLENLKDNWNSYSESWTSPRGVEPLFEILEVVSCP